MIVKRLELQNFRNYENLELDFSEGTNIISGNNAQGKTNILEAIYLCGTTKSHRGAKESDMIRFSEKEAHVRIYINRNGVDYKIDYHLSSDKNKSVAIDNTKVKKYSEIFSLISVVSFSPEDLSIIKDGPAARRQFCDKEICQLDKMYRFNLTSYNKTLQQRNQILKKSDETFLNPELLSIWDEQLADSGKNVIEIRANFIREIGEIAKRVHRKLTGDAEELTLIYEPNTKAEDLKDAIKNNLRRDMAARMTLSGPHRDDICFLIKKEGREEIDVRKFGSQGQQRTVALSVKLAEIEFVKQKINNNPIILLDDVLSELDRNRQKQLIDGIEGMQTIITCTGLEEFVNSNADTTRAFKVENGCVSEIKKEVR